MLFKLNSEGRHESARKPNQLNQLVFLLNELNIIGNFPLMYASLNTALFSILW